MNWNSPEEVERLLAADAEAPEDDWRRVADYLVSSFARFLGQEIECLWGPVGGVDFGRDEFSLGMRSRAVLGGPLGVEWYGVICAGQGHVEAIILLFAQDQRVLPFDQGEHLRYQFVRTPEGIRRWESRGWSRSEMGGEWGGYRRLSEVCRRMGESSAS